MKRMYKVLKEMRLYWILYSVFFIIAILISVSEIKGFGVFWFDNHRNNFLNLFFETVTRFGEFYIFLIFILFYLGRNSRLSIAIASIGISILPLSFFLKSYFKHPRPITYIYNYIKKYNFKGIENIDYHTGHNSFPSGHTFGAFALFTLLALSTKNKYLKITYLFLAILVGLSRIYLAQHFIEDVVFGSFLGICLAIIFYYLFFILWKNKKWMDFRFNLFSKKD